MISTLGHRVLLEGANAEPCQPWRHSAGIETSRFFGANIGRPGSTLIEVFRFAGDSPLEGDGFEPSVPAKFSGCPVDPRAFTFRNITGSLAPGTDGSNPSPSSEESCANLIPR
jgi:hypothetical protein